MERLDPAGFSEGGLATAEAVRQFGHLAVPPLQPRPAGRPLGSPIRYAAYTEGGATVGLALAHVPPGLPTVELLSVWVDAAHRRRGVATELLERIERAAQAAGSRAIEGRYRTAWPSAEAIERLLARRGWDAPRVAGRVYAGRLDRAREIGRMPLFQIPEGYTVVPWAELTAADRALVEAGAFDAPPSVDPRMVEAGYEPGTSVALRHHADRLVGWCLTHRTRPDTIEFTALWVAPAHREQGLSLLLAVEVGRRMADVGLARGQFVVEPDNEPMARFVEDHLLRFGYLSADAEIRLAGKKLI